MSLRLANEGIFGPPAAKLQFEGRTSDLSILVVLASVHVTGGICGLQLMESVENEGSVYVGRARAYREGD